MTLTPPGYARPAVSGPVAAAAEAAIAAACPGAVVAPWAGADAPVHPLWGPHRQILTGHATDPAVRHAGSSGGMISALAIHAIAAGMVDGVAHIRCHPDEPLTNIMQIARDAAAVLAGAGSRYGPTSPLAALDEILAGSERLLIIGKPCDISALRQLARVDPRVTARLPIMLSFFCGGMPSLDGTHRILKQFGMTADELASFRYRGNGWPGEASATTHDGRSASMSYRESWGGHLSGEVQFRCKICPDAVGGVADIACADAWHGGDSGYPSFDTADGRSLVIARTPVGDALLAGALAAGVCAVEASSIADIDAMQPGQRRRKQYVGARSAAARMLLQPLPRMAGLGVAAAARGAGLRATLHNFLGTARRIIVGRK